MDAQITEEVEVTREPEPEPPTPVRPLGAAKADLEKHFALYKAFVAELESTRGQLEQAGREEEEILSFSDHPNQQEQLERLTRTLALKMVLERKLERGQESGFAAAAGQLGAAVREALRSLWQELAALRAKREEKHLATLKKLVADEVQWPWAIEAAKRLMRHFGDIRVLDHLGEAADFSLSHGAIELSAEQTLADIGTFEGEKAAKR